MDQCPQSVGEKSKPVTSAKVYETVDQLPERPAKGPICKGCQYRN